MIQPSGPNQPNLPEPTVYTPNNTPPFPAGPNPPGASYQPGGDPQPGNYPQPGGYSGYPGQPAPQRNQNRGWLIGMVVLVVILIGVGVAALATHGFRQEPPSSWLSTPTEKNSSTKAVGFITWNNQDGSLTGTMEFGDHSGFFSEPFTGTYNYQDHSVILIFNINGKNTTVTGTVNGDTMTLSDDSSSLNNTNNTLIFHSATLQDFQNAKNQLP